MSDSKKIPFWKPSREYKKFKPEIDAAINGCLERGEYTLGYYNDGGEEIGKFERDFAKWLGVKRCVLTGSGTQSLMLAYRAAGIGAGDEVITVSHTFIATIDQIVAVGAKPILVDIGEDGLMDVSKIEAAITEKTKAIVPVHLEGKICDMRGIMALADKYGLTVIEDAAQAIGASYGGRKAGTIGKLGCFSFYPAKILGAIGNCGAVVTDDEALADRIAQLRCNYSIGKNKGMVEFGYNLEPDAIHAAVLNVKLKYLDDKLARRKAIAKRYDEAFAGLPLILPTVQEGERTRSYQDYVIRVTSESSRELAAHLRENGIGILGTDLIPNHVYPELGLNYDLPNTCEYLAKQIRLPCNPEVEDDEVNAVIKAVIEFYAK
jgi:dTDP-4-amino-4,6-dideoxygalactose transaminase